MMGLRVRFVTMKIGLISDTHGLVRPEALRALAGVERIIHAGDVGGASVIDALRAIAPVDVVRGNNDKDPWGIKLPPWLALEFEGVGIHVLHDINEMDVDPAAAGFRVVVAGHSHKPLVTERDAAPAGTGSHAFARVPAGTGSHSVARVLFVNPGSAGPRRFKLPVTVGYLTVSAGTAHAQIQSLL
jgi:uncharacterized protein